jgi:hypothetical protein
MQIKLLFIISSYLSTASISQHYNINRKEDKLNYTKVQAKPLLN